MNRRLKDPMTRVKCVEVWRRCACSADTWEFASIHGINTGWTTTLDRKSENPNLKRVCPDVLVDGIFLFELWGTLPNHWLVLLGHQGDR